MKDFHHLLDTTPSQLLDQPRPNDAIVVAKYGRISFSIQDLLAIVDDVQARRAEFLSLDDDIVTNKPASQQVAHVFASIAQCENDRISLRTRERLAARTPRRFGGWPPALSPECQAETQKIWELEDSSSAELASRFKVCSNKMRHA